MNWKAWALFGGICLGAWISSHFWHPDLETRIMLMMVIVAVSALYGVAAQLNRMEGKLDTILAKEDGLER